MGAIQDAQALLSDGFIQIGDKDTLAILDKVRQVWSYGIATRSCCFVQVAVG